jgi:hypothetical protein
MRLVALALLALGSTSLVYAAPAPFTATYAVSRDGKVIGESTVHLSEAANGEWTLISETHGTAGMARMLGLDVREESRFRWDHDKPESLSYDYRQDVALKHKKRHAEFDWRAGEAQVNDGDKQFRFAVV